MRKSRIISRRVIARAAFAVAALAVAVRPLHAQMQAGAPGSPVVELLTKAKNALNDLSYAKADTLARQVLALGTLLTPDQNLAAIQVRAAAFYPEEAGAQKTDSAVVAIRLMIAAGGKSIPRDISWGGLDSLVLLVARASEPGKVLLGSRTPGAVLYINDAAQGLISTLRTLALTPAVDVKLSVRAEKCVTWDTTMMVRAADSVRVGIRNLKCQP